MIKKLIEKIKWFFVPQVVKEFYSAPLTWGNTKWLDATKTHEKSCGTSLPPVEKAKEQFETYQALERGGLELRAEGQKRIAEYNDFCKGDGHTYGTNTRFGTQSPESYKAMGEQMIRQGDEWLAEAQKLKQNPNKKVWENEDTTL